MKRFWLVMLSLGLVLAFSASAMAVDVKFSGSMEVAGIYLDKTNLQKNLAEGSDVSTAFYYQTMRINTDFIVSPGLKLVTRFDVLNRVWGGNRTAADTGIDPRSLGTTAETENISVNMAYISYASPIGLFDVGYIHDNMWGTSFGDNDKLGRATGGIAYLLPVGHALFAAIIYKEAEGSYYYNNAVVKTDGDNDKYVLLGMYNFTKDTNAGLLYSFSRVGTFKDNFSDFAVGTHIPGFWGAMIYLNTLQPYVKAKFGPVAVEAEFWYGFGNVKWEDNAANAPAYLRALGVGTDLTISQWMAYVNAVADFGMVYAGGTFAYVSGDDPGTKDKLEGGFLGGGADFNPCLIMFNNDLTYWVGAIPGYGGTSMSSQLYSTASNSGMQNALFGQLKAGVRPIAKLDINGSISYASADQKPTGISNASYGWEIDVTGTYKITNNLSYMLGGAYWFVGDYFKGNVVGADLRDEFMIINKLTLTF